MKKLTLFLFSTMLVFSKNEACMGPPTGYTFWMFMPLIHESQGIPYNYDLAGYAHETAFRYVSLDTAHYHINVDEWSKQLGGKANRNDIFNLLYHTSPYDYWYDEKGDLAQNTFLKTLKSANFQEEKVYLDFAKACESLYAENDVWSESDDELHDEPGFYRLLAQGEEMLKIAKKPFVRLRTAYLMLKLCDYLKENEKLVAIYQQYVKPSPLKSWVKNTSLYHVWKACNDDLYLLQAFAYSYDKREVAKRQISFEEKGIVSRFLKSAKNNHERASVYSLKAYQDNDGQNLPDLEKIYAFEPNNKDLPLIVAHEINDLDDWILTYELTDFQHTYRPKNKEDPYGTDGEYSPMARDKFHQMAYQADLKYLAKFRLFVARLLNEKRVANPNLIRLAAAHLAFLAKDYASAKNHLQILNISQKTDNQIFIQKNILKYVISIKEKRNKNAATDASALALFQYLDKIQKDISNYQEFRSQIALLIGQDYIACGSVPKGTLLLCQSDRNYGEIGFNSKNAYHNLLDIGQPKDYEGLIALAKKTKQQRSAFETFLLAKEVSYDCNRYRWWGGETVEDPVWEDEIDKNLAHCNELDTCRILDYKGTYYLNHDNLKMAYATWNRIPNVYWERDPYRYYIKNPLNGARHSKRDYIKSILDLEAALDTAKTTKGYIYNQLGNAYYDMSYHGKSWLMREIYKSSGYYWLDIHNGHVNPREYYGNEKAKFYYKKAYPLAKNALVAANIGHRINLCAKNMDYYLLMDKMGRDYNYELENAYQYKGTNMDKDWAQRWKMPVTAFEETWQSNCEADVYLSYW
jgi:hypothetical protein